MKRRFYMAGLSALLTLPFVNADILKDTLTGPLKNTPEFIFCTRTPYTDGHWYANIGYYCDDANKKAYAENGAGDTGLLYRYNLRTREKKSSLTPKAAASATRR